jgi:hypothetical protein
MRKRIHRPANADAYQNEEKKRPQDIPDSIFRLTSSEKPKGHGDHRGKQQKRLDVRHRDLLQHGYALRPRAASYACNAAKRFSTPAVAKNRVP